MSKEKTKANIVNEFLKHFEDGLVDEKVTREEFFDYYSAVSASIDSDTYFDLIIRQVFKL